MAVKRTETLPPDTPQMPLGPCCMVRQHPCGGTTILTAVLEFTIVFTIADAPVWAGADR